MKIKAKIKKNKIEYEWPEFNLYTCKHTLSGKHIWTEGNARIDREFLGGLMTLHKTMKTFKRCCACGIIKG